MIEYFSRKRMVVTVLSLIGLSIVIIILENELTPETVRPIRGENVSSHIQAVPDCQNADRIEILVECRVCTEEQRNGSLKAACEKTGKVEKVRCHPGLGELFQSCEIVRTEEQRKFTAFGAIWFFVACFSTMYVVARQRELDEKILMKINKQIAAGV